MNKLDEIIEDANKEQSLDKRLVKQLAIKFAKHILDEAAENAKIANKKVLCDDPKEGDSAYMNIQVIDKESITSVINKYL